jgi:hypothetical protein
MNKLGIAAAICAAFLAGVAVPHALTPAQAAGMMMSKTSPAQGWNVHIDADQHFGAAHPAEIAHHWCKPVANGLIECQLYTSDAANATLVGMETIVSRAAWMKMPASERAMWHYHKTELAKIHATLPDMTPAQAKKFIAMISPTYGKVWIMYDPMRTNNMPTGQPSVTVLK